MDMPDRRQRILDALARNAEAIGNLEAQHTGIVAASESSNADDEHDPEGSTIAFEREQVSSLLQAARAARTDLELALERLADDSYGICESCGGPIGEGRLEARPGARTCITCASRA
jgi:RNA polymerase-binding transcription factor DksA